jgi:formylglycine-generating enzyme required for sulfatase activity
MQASKPKNARRLAHLWAFFFPAYLFTAAAFDSTEVTNREYLKFVLSTRHAAPEGWNHGRFPQGQENDPVVLVNFHEATAYCRFVGL